MTCVLDPQRCDAICTAVKIVFHMYHIYFDIFLQGPQGIAGAPGLRGVKGDQVKIMLKNLK